MSTKELHSIINGYYLFSKSLQEPINQLSLCNAFSVLCQDLIDYIDNLIGDDNAVTELKDISNDLYKYCDTHHLYDKLK